MNILVKTIVLSAVMSLPAFASGDHNSNKADASSGPMAGGMMGQQQMMDMRQEMQENSSLMEEIEREKDVDKRSKLLKRHMDSMQEQMQMMDKVMEDNDHDGKSSGEMIDHIESMDRRMNMMQMMMKQIIEHPEQNN